MGNFSKVLKKIRLNHNLTQAELAKQLGISRSSVGMYESGEREPDFETLETIADFFNVDMNYLLGNESRSIYYLDPEAAAIAQEVYERPEMRMLFDASRKISPEDMDLVISMIDRLKKDESPED